MNIQPQTMHLNPSRHKIPFLHKKPPLADSSIPTHDNVSNNSSSLSKLHLPSSSLSQSQYQNPDLTQDNRLLKLRLDQLKQSNRELLKTLINKQQEITKVDEEYKQLMFRYRNEMQRTNRKMRALIRESPEDNDGVILKSRVILTPTSANFYEDRSKSHNHKFLQIREAFDSLDFREVEKLANSNARSAPYSPQSRH